MLHHQLLNGTGLAQGKAKAASVPMFKNVRQRSLRIFPSEPTDYSILECFAL